MTFVYIRYMWHLNTFDTCVVCIHMIHSIHMTEMGREGPLSSMNPCCNEKAGLSTVWPDLAKFCHFDEFKSLWQLLKVNHLPFGKILILLTLAIAYVIWQIFTGVNWQKLKKQSSHPATLTVTNNGSVTRCWIKSNPKLFLSNQKVDPIVFK